MRAQNSLSLAAFPLMKGRLLATTPPAVSAGAPDSTSAPSNVQVEAAVLNHWEGLLCSGKPGIDLIVGGPDGADQFQERVQLLPADVLAQFLKRNFLVRHAQLPPEAHQVAALLRLPVVREAAVNHGLDAPPLVIIAKAIP